MIVFGLHGIREFTRARTGVHARGLVARNASLNELLVAIDAVRRGREFVSPEFVAQLERSARSVSSAKVGVILTKRELEVANLLARFLTNKQIGGRLGLSENTVKAHLRQILSKLHVRGRGEVTGALVRESSNAPHSRMRERRSEGLVLSLQSHRETRSGRRHARAVKD